MGKETIKMKKTAYINPEIEVIVLKERLLEDLPKDSNIYNDDPILGKENNFDEEESNDILDSRKNLWDN